MPLSRRRCELLNLCVRTSILAGVPSRCGSICRLSLKLSSVVKLAVCHGRWFLACVSGWAAMEVVES